MRKEVLAGARGSCLEIGAGFGTSIPAWPEGVTRLVLTEPNGKNRAMIDALLAEKKLCTDGHFPMDCTETLDVTLAANKSLPFDDESFDVVFVSLVLCCVEDQRASCAEIRRVLKPGGKLCFMEHVCPTTGVESHTVPLRNWLWSMYWECSATRETHSVIKEEFKDVKYQEQIVPLWRVQGKGSNLHNLHMVSACPASFGGEVIRLS